MNADYGPGLAEVLTYVQGWLQRKKLTTYAPFFSAIYNTVGAIVRILESTSYTVFSDTPADQGKALLKEHYPAARYPVLVADMQQVLRVGLHIPCLEGPLELLTKFKSLVETYGSGRQIMDRTTARSMIRKIFDSASETALFFQEEIKLPHSVEEVESIWEEGVIEHVRLLPSCTGVVLYIADKILEQEIDSFSESLVVLLVVTPQKAAQYLDKLNFITEDHLSDNFRIIINCSEFGPILTQIHESSFGKSKIPILINKEALRETVSQESLASLEENESITFVSGTIGFPNFTKMSTLLWVGSVEEDLSADFAKNGTLVQQAVDMKEVSRVLESRPFWLTRIVVDEQSTRQEIVAICYLIRRKFFSYAPILIYLRDQKQYELSSTAHPPNGFQILHNLPLIKETTDMNELLSFCFMSPLTWDRSDVCAHPASTSDSPKNSTDDRSEQEPNSGDPAKSISSAAPLTLVIHSTSCQFLCPTSVGSSPSPLVLLFLNSDTQPVQKSKPAKKTIFPNWKVDWKQEVKLTDKLKFEIYDKVISENSFMGLVEKNVWQIICDSGEKLEATFVLRAQDPHNPKKLARVRGTIRIEISAIYPVLDAPVKYFSRPLSESMEMASSSAVVHPVYSIFARLPQMRNTEGIFRLPGSTTYIQQLQQSIEKGDPVNLVDVPMNDLASLLKLFFVSLPDTLLPQSFYDTYKVVAKDPDEKSKMAKTRALFQELPVHNRHVLIDLLLFLKQISKNSKYNKMTCENLSVCWAPTIVIPNSVSCNPSQMLWDSHSVTQYFGVVLMTQGWMIDKSEILWPEVDESNPRGSMDVTALTPSTTLAYIPPSLRNPVLLMQRHLAPQETEETSPYFAQLKIVAQSAISNAPATLASSGGVSVLNIGHTTPGESPKRTRSGSVNLSNVIDKRFSPKTRNRSSSTIFNSSPLASPRGSRKEKEKGSEKGSEKGETACMYRTVAFVETLASSTELEAAKRTVRQTWEGLSTQDKQKLKEFLHHLCEEV